MATDNKDFKVKNGLAVTNGGTFGGAVTVGTPTIASHAATKAYVDSLTGSMAVSSTAPSSPTNGTQWLDTGTNRVNFYYDGSWYTQATIDDTNTLSEHIHTLKGKELEHMVKLPMLKVLVIMHMDLLHMLKDLKLLL